MSKLRALFLMAVATLGASTAAHAGEEGAFPTECSAVTRALEGGGDHNTVLRMRCPFSVGRINFYTSRKLLRVDPSPTVTGVREGEAMTCRKGRRRGVCQGPGGLKAQARMVIRFAVAHGPCKRPRLTVKTVTTGGVDGEPGKPVPAILLGDRETVERPRGCPHQ